MRELANFFSNSELLYRRRLTYTNRNGIALPRNHRAGLVTSIAADTDHDVSIAVGQARDTGDTANILVTTAIEKRIDATWAVGTTNGGLTDDAAVAVDTWYHLFALGKADGSDDYDAGWDTEPDASTLLVDTAVVAAGFTTYRRVASMKTGNPANLQGYTQYGGTFVPDVIIENASETPAHNTPANVALDGIPTGVSVMAHIIANWLFTAGGANCHGTVYTPGQTDPTVTLIYNVRIVQALDEDHADLISVRTDTSAQIRHSFSTSDTSAMDRVDYAVASWDDDLGDYD